MNVKIYAAGDFAEAFCNKFTYENIIPAPVLLRGMRASSLCFAALNGNITTADDLNADYLQLTKAEKDLNEKSGKKE